MSEPTPAPTREQQLDVLAEICAKFAAEQLERHDEFYPFAATIAGRQVQMVAAETTEERPAADAVITLLAEGLRRQARAGEIDGCAIAADVRVVDGDRTRDALRLDVEHRGAPPITVFLPYTRPGGQVEFGDPLTEPGTVRAFG
ncbi:MAG TPA: hypothetical protein VGN54_08635 [Mycobacteriales bacterium]|nr:hypothetical protein [Mycobacteriales bacterium]